MIRKIVLNLLILFFMSCNLEKPTTNNSNLSNTLKTNSIYSESEDLDSAFKKCISLISDFNQTLSYFIDDTEKSIKLLKAGISDPRDWRREKLLILINLNEDLYKVAIGVVEQLSLAYSDFFKKAEKVTIKEKNKYIRQFETPNNYKLYRMIHSVVFAKDIDSFGYSSCLMYIQYSRKITDNEFDILRDKAVASMNTYGLVFRSEAFKSLLESYRLIGI